MARLIRACAVLGSLAAFSPLRAAQPVRPNVLLVKADQWRGSAFSFGPYHDADVQTPHIETLASGGIRFDRCYATLPLCTPNRSTLITGRYPVQTRMFKNDIMLPPDIPCIGDVFSDAGYATYYCGKFHMDGSAKPGYVPKGWRRRGYTVFEGFNRGHEYYSTSKIFTDDGQLFTVPRMPLDLSPSPCGLTLMARALCALNPSPASGSRCNKQPVCNRRPGLMSGPRRSAMATC